MSTNRPAFANSLVAMYGSSPETSEDEDSDDVQQEVPTLLAGDLPVPVTEDTSDDGEGISSQEEGTGSEVLGTSFSVSLSATPCSDAPIPKCESVNESFISARENSNNDLKQAVGTLDEKVLIPILEEPEMEIPTRMEHKEFTMVSSKAKDDLPGDTRCRENLQKSKSPVTESFLVDAAASASSLHSGPSNATVQDTSNYNLKGEVDDSSFLKVLNTPLESSDSYLVATEAEPFNTGISICDDSVETRKSSERERPADGVETVIPQESEADLELLSIPVEFNMISKTSESSSSDLNFTTSHDVQPLSEKRKRSPSPEKTLLPGGRRLRQVRNPSAKAAEAAADAAFVATVTPTRKNLKEAKIACALAKVDSGAVSSKKALNTLTTTRLRRGRSSSHERSLDSRTSPITFPAREDSSSSEKSNLDCSSAEGKLCSISEEMSPHSEDATQKDDEVSFSKSSEVEKPIGIKLKISRESVQILDPNMSKLEVQIPTEPVPPEVTSSPGGTKRLRKLKEGTPSPVPPLSPITLKIAKSKEGLEVVSSESTSHMTPHADSEGKVEKITVKLSRDEGAKIVKTGVDEPLENKPEKITLKLVKDEASNTFLTAHSSEDVEESKKQRITLKLLKSDNSCIVKKREPDFVSSSSDYDGAKVEKLTLKLSTDNNVSIVRPKDTASLLERVASPEPGKVEKITLKVSKNDNVSIVKPSSPTPSLVGIEKLTLKMSRDGTAAVSGKQPDELAHDGENSKVEKITFKLSKDEGVSIVKPASPIPERKAYKVAKDEPLSPLSPLLISRMDDGEPQKERITLKLSKAGGHPSPVGVIDERSSWSIKSTDSDNVPSPVTSDPATPKSRPKRALTGTPEPIPISAKRLKLSGVEKCEDVELVAAFDAEKHEELSTFEESKMDVDFPIEFEPEALSDEPKKAEERVVQAPVPCISDDMDIIVLDSEDSQSTHPPESNEQSMSIENEKPRTRFSRRKPRGRPRKAVLTPGASHAEAANETVDEEIPSAPTPKPKKEKVRPEPIESDRPKRSCKGREKPPPKPAKPVKPRGKAATLKQKAEQSIQPEEPQLFEEETRMSADCGSLSETPVVSSGSSANNGLIAKVMVSRLSENYQSLISTQMEIPIDSPGPAVSNEESQASQGSVSLVSSTTESTPNRGNRKGRMEINVDPDAQVEFTVDMIAEYTWPLNDSQGETYMIQEQISSYLGVKSFKRKYPNMQRRTVDHEERQYLFERKLVSESLCDLGLTALLSNEVLDVLCTDFPEKFEEYRRFTREKVQREFSNKQKALLAAGTQCKEDSKSKAVKNMASFNAMLNRSRRDQRRCCFDLQSFTVHYPEERRRRMTVPNAPRIGPYPVALVPGQYTDYYKEFTSAELRYFPLNTVLYGPLLPHEMMRSLAGGSDGSQTDSSDSSSSDSSSSDSDSSGSDSESDSDSSSDSGDDSLSLTGPEPVETLDFDDRPDAVCRICSGDRQKNKLGRPEPLVHCASCEKSGHLSCLDLTVDMIPHIRKYSWHCTDCKLCAQCNDTADEDKMLFCDMCDRGYHIYCVGLRKVPEGRWHCQECALCASCGARDPGGTEEHQATQNLTPQDTPTKADAPQWQHEFKKGDQGARIYVRTLCVPCSKLWRKGRYCRLCWKCFTNQPEEEGLINCSICDRWMHGDCCRKAGRVIDPEKQSSYICELCQQKGVRATTSKPPVKIVR